MTIAYFRNHQTEIPSKVIFLNDFETVVESFFAEGMYFIIESHVDQHKEEVKWEELHGFFTPEDANDYFKNCIRDNPAIRLCY